MLCFRNVFSNPTRLMTYIVLQRLYADMMNTSGSISWSLSCSQPVDGLSFVIFSEHPALHIQVWPWCWGGLSAWFVGRRKILESWSLTVMKCKSVHWKSLRAPVLRESTHRTGNFSFPCLHKAWDGKSVQPRLSKSADFSFLVLSFWE